MPFEGSGLDQLEATCHQEPLSSRGVVVLFRVLTATEPSALSVWRFPSTVRSLWEPGHGAFCLSPRPIDFGRLAHPLVRFESPSEFDRPILPHLLPVGSVRGAFHGLRCPYGVVSLRSPLTPGLPHPVRSAYRLSQPLSGLLLRQPCGFVSPRRHPWGSLFRAFSSQRARRLAGRPFPSWRYLPVTPRDLGSHGAQALG